MQARHTDSTSEQQQRVNSYFERKSEYWSEIYRLQGVKEVVHQERLSIVLGLVDALSLPVGARVLEAGCGAGFAAVALGARGYAVEAFDSVPKMVELTRARAAGAGQDSQVRCSVGDLHSLHFPDAAFDLVYALGVLPWLPSIEKPLQELSRVLKPRGYLIVTVDNRWSLRWMLEPLTNPLLRPARELARRLRRRSDPEPFPVPWVLRSIRQCDTQLEQCGVSKVRGITLGFGPLHLFEHELLPFRAGLKLHRLLQRLADNGYPIIRSAGSQYIVLGRKNAPPG